MASFPFFRQLDVMDCGPTCLRMVAKFYGKNYSINRLRTQADYSREGVSMLGIAIAAEGIGFKSKGVRLSYKQLIEDVKLPAIIHWGQTHFVVLVKVKNKKLIIANPAKKNIITVSREEFLERWAQVRYSNETKSLNPSEVKVRLRIRVDDDAEGLALLLETTPEFHKQEGDKNKKLGWGLLLGQLSNQRRYIFQLLLGLLVGSMLQLIFPYLTQSIVDTGINTQNIHFIYIVLLAQFMLMFSRSVVEFIRSRILLHISTKINIQLLSSFWMKLMRLPLSYFDTKSTGDIQQRLSDQHRIESFLTGSTLSTFFSLFTFFIFAIVLLQYNSMVFFIFAVGSVLYFLWIRIFLKYRRNLDYKRFAVASKENTATMQLIQGMQEIKLNNAEHLKRWEWEGLQASLFKLQFKSLSLSQWQQAGAFFINEGKNILITFFVAKAVIEGSLTLGQMLAIQYIIGQLNSPIEQMIGFAQQFQDAKISLERLNEIHELEDEDTAPSSSPDGGGLPKRMGLHAIERSNISFRDVTFTYPGAGNEPVLKNINIDFPAGKVTAIVGMSGSGKTTILKLIQKFYENYKGEIRIGGNNKAQSSLSSSEHPSPAGEGMGVRSQSSLESSPFPPPPTGGEIEGALGVRLNTLNAHYWRTISGSVMQDGFIFNDNIAKNIAVSDENPNYEKLIHACKVANILSFIESMPLGFNTKIGAEGNGISAGQKQRILIARAVYKNPQFLFFDEATNALDANNEKAIMENLQEFFKGRTVLVVAHRLSTVKNADKIVVLENGEIIEEGNHESLSKKKGKYYELVKNQLELGN